MVIKKLGCEFSVCKVSDFSQVNLTSEFCFLGKTDEEYSVVCLTSDIPTNTLERDDGWAAFRIEGVLDFSLVGILAKISTILAENQIPIFAVSTYNTDYILTRRETLDGALQALSDSGYEVI